MTARHLRQLQHVDGCMRGFADRMEDRFGDNGRCPAHFREREADCRGRNGSANDDQDRRDIHKRGKRSADKDCIGNQPECRHKTKNRRKIERVLDGGYAYFVVRHRALSDRLLPIGLDDFRHGDAETVFENHDFTTRNQTIIDVNVDCLTNLTVEFHDRAAPQLQ